MAKSYMQNRPAWASPSLKFAEVGSPSPLGVQRLMEETPKSTLRSSEVPPLTHYLCSYLLIRITQILLTSDIAPLLSFIFLGDS